MYNFFHYCDCSPSTRLQVISTFSPIQLVFIKDSVKNGLREMTHEHGVRVLRDEGTRGCAGLSQEAQEVLRRNLNFIDGTLEALSVTHQG